MASSSSYRTTPRFSRARRAPRELVALGDHREHRLAEILHEAVARIGSSCEHRAAVVLAGDVLSGDHGDDARRRAHRVEIERYDPRMRMPRHPECGVQRAAQFGDVVGVGRLAADMQRRRFVRRPRRSPRFERRARCKRFAYACSSCSFGTVGTVFERERIHVEEGERRSPRVSGETPQHVARHLAAIGARRAHVGERLVIGVERASSLRCDVAWSTCGRRSARFGMRRALRRSGHAAERDSGVVDRAVRRLRIAKAAQTAEMSWS